MAVSRKRFSVSTLSADSSVIWDTNLENAPGDCGNGSARISPCETHLRTQYHFAAIIGHHESIISILKIVSQVADTSATVLIQGESGTGKELVARSLHDNSRRRSKPFVPINCGAMPENLLETELFGHVRGAFTGAVRDNPGWLQRADGGTIFLDEVCEMSPSLQVKLLRVLQTGDYSPVGNTQHRTCDVRVVAATNKDLRALVKQGRFRDDLFYRLNVIDIEMPRLAQRRSDISLLVAHFVEVYAKQFGKANVRFSDDALALLLAHDFPGNVRELENIVQRGVALTEDALIRSDHLPLCVTEPLHGRSAGQSFSAFKVSKQRVVERFEREYVKDCLMVTQGNISNAANLAGIDIKNFYTKMKKYEIDAHSFKVQAD